MKLTSFSAESLSTTLDALAVSGPYYVAYSGGLDSHVLLHALYSNQAQSGNKIHALYVNHGINDDADTWGLHCELVCRKMGVEFTHLRVVESCPRGESTEAWARDARYSLLRNEIGSQGVLLTAHHQEDQAETLLLQMIRGSGAKGLAAMPLVKSQDGVIHVRPLLAVNRKQIITYAQQHKLQWIEDESNSNLSFDRNYIRQEIFPRLRERWPTISRTFARVTSHQAEVVMLLEEIAEEDLHVCIGDTADTLNIEQVLLLSSARQQNVIRYWISQLNFPAPSSRKIHQILSTLLSAKEDASPLVTWRGCDIRRYQLHLYAGRPLSVMAPGRVISWQLDSVCKLDDGVLSAKLGNEAGIKDSILSTQQVQIKYRKGGERIQLPGKNHRQELKKLFQEKGIPPWLRDRIPLLYMENKLIAVADLWTDVEAFSSGDELCWKIIWNRTGSV